jgi:hypothetical protein
MCVLPLPLLNKLLLTVTNDHVFRAFMQINLTLHTYNVISIKKEHAMIM